MVCRCLHWGAMSLLKRPRSTVRYSLWLAGLLVILGGLFGMHGLDNHGGAGMDTVARAGMAVPAHGAASGHPAMTGATREAAAVAAIATQAVATAATDAAGHEGMDMDATGMCMAVLVLSLLALILRLYASRVRPLLWLDDRPERSPMARGRDPDPPSLLRLSIQRC